MLTYMYVMYVRIPTHVRHDATHSCEISHFVSHMCPCSPRAMHCAFPATHCNTLQHADLYGDTPQHTTHCAGPAQYGRREHGHMALQYTATHCNSLQLTATHRTHRNTLHTVQALRSTACGHADKCVTATHCNTLQHTATHYTLRGLCAARCAVNGNTLQHTATHCNTTQHSTHCAGSAQHGVRARGQMCHCNTLQHTATHCYTLQHITHCVGPTQRNVRAQP